MLVLTAFILLGCDSNNSYSSSNTEKEIDPEGAIVPEEKPSNWYIQLTAEEPAQSMKTFNAQLGEVNENDAVKKHTLRALKPYGRHYLNIVFHDPDGIKHGDYKSCFHRFREGKEESWKFTVQTDNTMADIKVGWRGIYILEPYMDAQGRQRYSEYHSLTNPLIKNMKLVDMNTSKEIAAIVDGKVQTYTFNMNGQKERTFQWIVQPDTVQQDFIENSNDNTTRNIVETRSLKRTNDTKIKTFDLSKPPMISEKSNGR